jgi:hypothetical protein
MKNLDRITALVVTLLLSTAVGWSCRYEYGSETAAQLTGMTRTNRFTGRTDVLWPSLDWLPYNAPMSQVASMITEKDNTWHKP